MAFIHMLKAWSWSFTGSFKKSCAVPRFSEQSNETNEETKRQCCHLGYKLLLFHVSEKQKQQLSKSEDYHFCGLSDCSPGFYIFCKTKHPFQLCWMCSISKIQIVLRKEMHLSFDNTQFSFFQWFKWKYLFNISLSRHYIISALYITLIRQDR